MKVFIPLDENSLRSIAVQEELVPFQPGYLVLSQLDGDTAVWAYRPVKVQSSGSGDHPAPDPALPLYPR